MIIDKIAAYTGLRRNFIISASDVPNAAAITRSGERYLLYNQEFMDAVKRKTHTYWAAISIMAHEIGHHLQGHTLDGEGSRPDKEIEADEYSGFILQKMGATLEEAQAAINTLSSEVGSSTHPSKQLRLLAIRNGWTKSLELNGAAQQRAIFSAHDETQHSNRYKVKNGLVKDSKTGLMWTRCSIGQNWNGATCQGIAAKYRWEQIMTKHFDYAGYKDWRVPKFQELKTLLCNHKPAKLQNRTRSACEEDDAIALMNEAFPNMPVDTPFWSASHAEHSKNNVWIVDFFDGSQRYDDKNNYFAVRLVRKM
jgi:hypothetical protein